MPGIDRRRVSAGLLLVDGVAQYVVKCTICRGSAKIEFANGIAHAVSRIGWTVRVAGIGRLGHPDSEESHRHWSAAQANCFGLAFSTGDGSLRERLPDAASHGSDGVIPARPVLDRIVVRIGFGPCDTNAVDRLNLRQIDYHPLGMQRVALSCEVFGQIRIALPECVEVAIRK